MNDSKLVTVDDGREDLSHDHPALLFGQSDVSAEIVEQLALHAQLEDEEDVGRTLEVFDQLDDIGVTTDEPEIDNK